MDTAIWALAFTVLPWPESRKAALWASLQNGEAPAMPEAWRQELVQLEQRLPRLREEALAHC